ncbi:MAG: hypothetical protein KDB53_11710 [Planctomycetes bacterium]|nr:hypothetical protein [Planctomycetota bacterium]
MNRLSHVALSVLVLTTMAMPATAQVQDRWIMTIGFDEQADAALLGGSTEPNDVAWSAVTNRIFVSHDVAGPSPDLLLEYDLFGNLVQANVASGSIDGLCALPNGNLLASAVGRIYEVDASGHAVPGGIDLTIPGQTIHDLDFDRLGRLWIHDATTGAFATVDLATGAIQPQFQLSFGSEAFCFRGDNDNLMLATATFNNGGISTGTLLEVDWSGAVVFMGNSPGLGLLRPDNGDVCNLPGAAFSSIKGFAWIDSLDEMAMVGATNSNGKNAARFTPRDSSFIVPFGTAGLRGDGRAFKLGHSGDPVPGSAGFVLTAAPTDPGSVVALLVSTFPNCQVTTFPGVNGALLVFVGGGVGSVTQLLSPTTMFSIAAPLFSAPPGVSGLEIYVQLATTDASGPALAVLSDGQRIRF